MVSYTASKVIKIKRGKKIGHRKVKELVGSDFKEFMDSDRYETNFKKIPHILVFKVTFGRPWSVSDNQTDVLHLKLCKQDFPPNLI